MCVGYAGLRRPCLISFRGNGRRKERYRLIPDAHACLFTPVHRATPARSLSSPANQHSGWPGTGRSDSVRSRTPVLSADRCRQSKLITPAEDAGERSHEERKSRVLAETLQATLPGRRQSSPQTGLRERALARSHARSLVLSLRSNRAG
ncbi:hypothetical protein AAFF_G00019560 [Aldrovandia affinis]|uniref:Uncharacterized protein n=1 Tax=Aldrovandia affinis TaxID=143900 RepID=A0AAD7S5G8_9TELE|nr:hypothetical protein AAFF_G00019560 [Aldrovandia affinis]